MSDLPRAASESDKLIGEVLADRYAIESRIGEGAMGTVYKARHVKVGRAFAVKVLHPRLLNEEKLLKRFEREAELAGKLQHPNVIGVVDVGETPDGMHYMVMDFVSGPDLATILADAPLPAQRVIAIVSQLCDGLQHAHEKGLIHRDFKPENVIVEMDPAGNELPRIVDFGIAILQDAGESSTGDGRLTTNGLVLGTPHYMAPEQAVADPIDHRIDLFALGIIIYEMLTGKLPFDGTGAEVARANLVLDPPAMAKRVPHLEVDPLLEAFTRKLMAKNRDQRPPSAKAARELLDLIQRDRPSAAAVLGVDPSFARPPRATEPVRGFDGSGGPGPARRNTPPPSELDAPPMTAPRALGDPLAHDTSMATPLPWHNEGRKRGALIAGVAGCAIVIGVIAIVLHGGGTHDAPGTTPVPATDPGSGGVAIAPVPSPTLTTPPTTPTTTTDPAGSNALGSNTGTTTATAAGSNAAGSNAAGSNAVAIVPPTTAPTTRPGTTKPTTASITRKPADANVHPNDALVAIHTATPPPPVTQSHQTPIADPKPPTEITAKVLVSMYSSVGGELKALEDKHPEAASDLWPRYRLIRINDTLASLDKRNETAAILARLQHDIAARNK